MSKKYSFETFMEWYETQTHDGNFFGLIRKYLKELEANEDPTANDDFALDVEDKNTVTIDLLANDSDADGDTISVTRVGDAPNGTVTDNGDGTVTYVPNPNFNGTDTFNYTISDGKGGESTATVTILVEAVNDAPVVLDVSYGGVEEDGAAQVFAYGASDVDGDTLSYQILTQPVEGTVSDNGDGTFTFNPGTDFQDLGEGEARQVSFVYEASDGNGGSGQATATVTVTGTNDAPFASAHTAFDEEDRNTVTIDLLADAGDLDGDTLTVIYVEDAPNGTVTDNGDGTVTYVPDPDFNGTDTFSYTVSDGNGGESTGTVSVFVAPVNDAPVASDDEAQTQHDTAVIVDLLANDSDIDGDTLSIGSVGVAQNGTVSENDDGTVTYTPDTDFTGTDSFTYTVVDGNGGSATATATVIVDANALPDTDPAPPPPLVTAEIVVNAWGSSAGGVAPHMVLMVDGDIVGDVFVTATSETQYVFSVDLIPGQGHMVQVQFDNDDLVNGQDRNLFVPSIVVNGEVISSSNPYVSYDKGDLDGQDVIAGQKAMFWAGTLIFDLPPENFPASGSYVPTNSAPIANDVVYGGVQEDGQAQVLSYSATDPDGDTLTYTVVTQPSEGLVTDNGNGTFTFNPGSNFQDLAKGEVRQVSFIYEASDGNGGADSATATITVTGTNDAPVASIETAQTVEGTAVVLDLLANDSDIDGDTLTIGSIGAAQYGVIADNGDGTVTYTPNAGFSGSDTFTYTVIDGNGGSDTATATVTIDPPAPQSTVTEIVVNAWGDSAGGIAPYMTVLIDGVEVGNAFVSATSENQYRFFAEVAPDQSHDIQVRYSNDGKVVGEDRNLYVSSIVVNGGVVSSSDPEVVYDRGALDGVDVIAGQTYMFWGGTLIFGLAASFFPASDPNNTAPIAESVFAAIGEDDGAQIFGFKATDADGDPLTYEVASQPSGGSVTNNGDGTFSFDPASDFESLGEGETQDVSFTYLASDGRGGTDIGSATITVNGANDGPVAVDDKVFIASNSNATINVLNNDTDADGDTLSVGSVGSASNGTVKLNLDGTVSYAPNLDFSGTDSFEYTTLDGNGGVDTGVVTVSVEQGLPAPSGPAFYVSTVGNDSWSGTLAEPNADGTDGPFATVQHARDAMRSDTNIDTTYIREGTYYLSNRIDLGSQDSGVTFAAYPGESPVISGGQLISGFVDEGNGIYSAAVSLPTDLDLTIGGVRQESAQSGNFDPSDPYLSGWNVANAADSGASKTQFKFQTGDINPGDIVPGTIIEVFHPERWMNSILEVQSVDFTTNTVTLNGTSKYALKDGSTFKLYNNPDFIQNTGEFGWRASDGRLVVKPEDPMTFEQDGVVVSRLDTLFKAYDADNISFVGLTFQDVVHDGVALNLNEVDNSLLAYNTFSSVGKGIYLLNSTNNAIAGNDMKDIADTGIEMIRSDNNSINNNSFQYIGDIHKGGGAIVGTEVSYNNFANNLIEYSARYGISIKDAGTNTNIGNVIEYNRILHTNLETSDTGAIEMLGRSGIDTHTIIRYNYIEETGGVGSDSSGALTRLDWSAGIYLDDKASGVQIIGNFIKDAGWGSVYVHGGDNVLIENNIAVLDDDRNWWWQGEDSMEEFVILSGAVANADGMTNIDIVRNVIYAETPIEDHWWYIQADQPNFDYNLLFNTTRFADSGVTGDANSIIADPMFTDVLAGDYSFLSGSPAASLGITDLPWDQMGLNSVGLNILGLALPDGYAIV